LPRYAIGDVQGCDTALERLLTALHFNAERDQLTFVGDLVNRGPQSLQVLQRLMTMNDNIRVVLGNHDLHLLAHHFDSTRPLHKGDTLQHVLESPNREHIVEWLIEQPLAISDLQAGDLFIHAGLIPQWTVDDVLFNAAETSAALRRNPAAFLAGMYGNQPDKWQPDLQPEDRWRFTINVLTRLRYCKAGGRINLKLKDAPDKVDAPWLPWFEHPDRRSSNTRIVFGHWSTLGLMRRPGLLALDTGCVWGGSLTAINLDDADAPPIQVRCASCQTPGAD
jgi:bis(5'-nucleosyl)-tetraphosphatase (symmetrical)